jgi:RNA polymerase sigma-70 factor (sigma-E family)
VRSSIERASEDRDRIVAALFEQEYDHLRRLAYVILGDPQLAEEIVMEAFARALAGWKAFSTVEGPVPYLRRMVVNACRSKLRRRAVERRVSALLGGRPERVQADELDVRADALAIWRAVAALPAGQRLCVVLRYLEDLKESQIADVLDLPLGSVKSNLSRARARLADELGSSFGGDAR